MKKSIVIVGIIVFAAGCSSAIHPSSDAKDKINNTAHDNEKNVYIATHNVELNNYNKRLKIADDPTTILWCTTAFPVPSSPLFTTPIVGKLTSGAKRPFPSNNITAVGNSNSTENPDGQSMYGSSSDYRYGFTPDDAYAEYYNMATFCTTTPTVWQKEKTELAIATDPGLAAASAKAKAQLKAGDASGASETLKGAVAQAGGK